ncbi:MULTISPECIES: flagellar hook-associated family protein [Azorhizobium]|uniref:Flagellin n=1 Tax=Azorhizobium caulinodans (strain ATCC 43989 / DSM 5975 / JCM 20966 / LMG 6465 / NBRC 14845 / NCIMB 13405 / ORS 571) TaxID=438753 RepID=A8IPL9_AZOC5|nr:MULTISPECIES: flagellar hook-associated family protein [Azorhizobium]TDT88879.1 flagellar hook-associated protein 3 FlgL [Azorhizobium sp. AG788]BAF86647.1 putative flagellar hook-associated protein [Azorhizobium caulinodans ORS 571]
MQSSYISTMSWTLSAMKSITSLQTQIEKKNTELATGRYADIGLELGVKTSLSVDLRHEYNQVQGLLDSNSLTDSIMTRSQTGLTNILNNASTYQKTLLSSQASAETVTQMQLEGQQGLASLLSSLNTTDGTRYVFGGINSGQTPMKDFATNAQVAIQTAFQTAFGFPVSDPQAANITSGQMQTFLNNVFSEDNTNTSALFNDTNWAAQWSNASSTNLTRQISQTENVSVSTTANDTAMRKLAMAYSMMGYLGVGSLNMSALQTVMDTSRATLSAGMTGVTNTAAAIGVSQTRVTTANSELNKTLDVVKSRINSLESVDPAEAKTQLDTLTNQLSMSYSTTTKLLQLSIMNYA